MEQPKKKRRRPRHKRRWKPEDMTPFERNVLKLIKKATLEEPIQGDDIANLLNADVREVRQTVRDLRMKFHQPIGSRTNRRPGYWWMTSKHEAWPIYKSLWNRGWQIVRMAYKMKVIANNLPDYSQLSAKLKRMNDAEYIKGGNHGKTES